MSIETAVKAENGNGATKPAESHQNGNGAAKPVGNANGAVKPLETNGEKRERTRSLVIVYFTLFLQSLGLAATMTGVWPFLDKVSHYADREDFYYPFLIHSSTQARGSISSALSWRRIPSGSFYCRRCSDTGKTRCHQ